MKQNKKRKGFTLLEILLVIAAIGILAAIVLVAINPNRQIAQARNAQRRSDINTIYKALEQYLIDNKAYPTSIDETKKDICISANTPANCITLDELVPTYLSSIPKDPSGGVYKVYKSSENNRIGVEAAGAELGQSIVVNPTSTPAPTIVQNGLVLHLDAGDSESYTENGTTWFDVSGNGNNGTLNPPVGGPTYNSANGGSLVFDGANDFVEYSFTSPFAETVIVWVKSAGNNWNTDGWISASRNSNGHHIHPSANTKRMEYYVANSAGDDSVFIGSYTPVVEITTPHMYSYTTNGSNLHKGYFDGTEVVSSSASITRTTSPNAVTQYLGKDSILTRYGNGNIYIVLRYNRALTAEEIQQNYNALKGRFGL